MKNLLTLFVMLSALSLVGQDFFSRPSETGGGNQKEHCSNKGAKIAVHYFALPFTIPTSNINSGNGSTQVSVKRIQHWDGYPLNNCNNYLYRVDVYLNIETPIKLGFDCRDEMIRSYRNVSYKLQVGGQCLYDYLHSNGYIYPVDYNCISRNCGWITRRVWVCNDCNINDDNPDDEIEIGRKSYDGGSDSVWPNPFSSNLLYDLSNDIEKIELLDLSGRLINNVISPQERKGIIDTSDLEFGVYILKVKYLDGSYDSFKVVKQ